MISVIQQRLNKIKLLKDAKGLTLVESVVVIAIVGIVLVAFAVAMSTGIIAVRENDQEVTVQSLARTQMEYVKGYPYDSEATTYPTVSTTDNYSISVAVSSVPDTDANIQKVTTNISRDGQVMLTVEDYKVNR
jgi:prepilin-type N-terminal cleavage/methylation domain-containing protein